MFQMLFMFSLVTSILLTVISLAGYYPLFHALNAPANVFQQTYTYMKVIFYRNVFIFGYNAICSVLEDLKDSKSPLCFVSIATIINICLDIILIVSLEIGIKGVTYTTITAQEISFIISIFIRNQIYIKRSFM